MRASAAVRAVVIGTSTASSIIMASTMMRTTVAVTRFEGSRAYNVLPPSASFGINMRLMGGDTIESATEYLKKTVADDEIEISLVNGMNPSICSDTSNEGWEKLGTAIHEMQITLADNACSSLDSRKVYLSGVGKLAHAYDI